MYGGEEMETMPRTILLSFSLMYVRISLSDSSCALEPLDRPKSDSGTVLY